MCMCIYIYIYTHVCIYNHAARSWSTEKAFLCPVGRVRSKIFTASALYSIV